MVNRNLNPDVLKARLYENRVHAAMQVHNITRPVAEARLKAMDAKPPKKQKTQATRA